MKERDESQRRYGVTKHPEHLRKYKSLRNTINNRLRNEKFNWQKQKLEHCNNDSGKLWKNKVGLNGHLQVPLPNFSMMAKLKLNQASYATL